MVKKMFVNLDMQANEITNASLISAGNLQIDNININGAVISSNTGDISFSNENLTTTGKITGGALQIDNFLIDGTCINMEYGNMILCTKNGKIRLDAECSGIEIVACESVSIVSGESEIVMCADEIILEGDVFIDGEITFCDIEANDIDACCIVADKGCFEQFIVTNSVKLYSCDVCCPFIEFCGINDETISSDSSLWSPRGYLRVKVNDDDCEVTNYRWLKIYCCSDGWGED